MPRSSPVDGFSLSYADYGDRNATSVVLLHGWPGSSADYRSVVPLLPEFRLIVPDLRGFGASDRQLDVAIEQYSATGQARSVAALITELGLRQPVLAGYDVGSGVAQQIVKSEPSLARALAISPPVPGFGTRVLDPGHVTEFWYQSLHRLPLGVALLDGKSDQIDIYLRHFWNHWSGPDFQLDEAEFATLVTNYARPHALEASINWYRAGAGTMNHAATETPPAKADRLSLPTFILWPEHDPLFPFAWSDRLDEWFTDPHVHSAPDSGHFTPLEAPEHFANLIRTAAS